MKFKCDLTKALALSAALAAMSACSHGPVVQDFPSTANPGDEVKSLSAAVASASANQANVLAPHSFMAAQDALADAKKGLDRQIDSKDILHSVAQGRAYLNRATQFAQLSRTNMEDVVVARQQAISANAPTLFENEFATSDSRLMDVTGDIEENNLKSAAENRGALQSSYRDLELKAIKQTSLGQAYDTVALAVREGAVKFAPRTLAQAQKALADSDAFITANRHDDGLIKSRSDETLARANHVLRITRDSKTGQKTSSEETALQIEGEQNQVSSQQAKIVDEQAMIFDKQTELTEEQVATSTLSLQNRDLENREAFDKSFEQARSEFTPSEAEVYKQGNTLTIRLRGLDFPTAKAVLQGSNFALLAKVQKVIKDFGKSSIIVEGHTDSMGGSLLNQKLSADRAEAVRDYLVSNSGTQSLTITSIGYGFQKPLASNKTPQGRAQNRRVDVLIERTPGI